VQVAELEALIWRLRAAEWKGTELSWGVSLEQRRPKPLGLLPPNLGAEIFHLTFEID
jgi:hypothetical protein